AAEVGYPVVLKIASAEIAHKSDMGGVRLNLKDESAVRAAFAEILDNAARHAPEAQVDGVYVQGMLKPGLEVIIGVQNDPQFGPAVLVGLGGIFVEVFRDAAMLPAPFSQAEALGMLRSLKALPLFTGCRGRVPLDMDALAETVAKVSRLAAECRHSIAELDVNPVFVYPVGEGCCAADALIILSE
ncbi:MAG: acetate--CoA ligase family protein, partial [Desulfovibrionaceae bacterium]